MINGMLGICCCLIANTSVSGVANASDAALPTGVRAVWDMEKAEHEATPTRERISINGLWRWQPAGKAASVPEGGWGYYKVPGCWPGVSDYMQHDCQTVFTHPSFRTTKLAGVSAAWYQREISVPNDWAGRRIALYLEYVNSSATAFIDGHKAGEVQFPAGEIDLTPFCQPGNKHLLSLRVVARPLQEVMLMFNDTNASRGGLSRVERRGLCGDAYLVGTPAGPRIDDVKVDTSVRKSQIRLRMALKNLKPNARYKLLATIPDTGQSVRKFVSMPFTASDLRDGQFELVEKWKPEKLWDLHTPQNSYEVTAWLVDGDHKLLDESLPVRFGFREFWIDGRNFYLNGTRIFLSALPLDNAQVSALTASYAGAKESLSRLKQIGINFVYTHNYGCEPGSHLGFAEILRAADDVGMLVALSQPHFAQYDWKMPRAADRNGYAHHSGFYARVAGNHPSVVFYAMSHNATGYDEDMNPDLIDGVHSLRSQWSDNNVKGALAAEGIVARLDPSRIVYHHSSGNLSSMHTMNFYTNMAPSQELDDWFEHWATQGVKPLFTCEYMVPCTWDWTMYRGWYKGTRTFGSAAVPWEFCVAEWSSQFLGDRAYQISDAEKKNLRWEAEQFRSGRLWHRWDYPYQVGSHVFDLQHEIIGAYLAANWRAFRTWGVSAISPWEHDFFWTLRKGVDKGRKQLKVDWDNLQRPGFSPDYIDGQYERMDLAFEQSDWIPTVDGQAILRNNRPLLAYIGGKRSEFTSKDHNFYPGETVEKQTIVINNSRAEVTAKCEWSLRLSQSGGLGSAGKAVIATGQQEHIPLRFALPSDAAPGKYAIEAKVKFGNGEVQSDTFTINVMPKPEPFGASLGAVPLSVVRPSRLPKAGETPAPQMTAKIAVFDPKGETTRLLTAMGIEANKVEAAADLSNHDLLVVGKAALTADGPGPNLSRVPDGLKVVVFEQSPEALEKRLGFRVAEYGLRQVFPRVPNHRLLAGLNVEHLRDWRGYATLQPPRLDYNTSQSFGGPAVQWCGLEVPRVWRCGNRGNVASVLIEKPARGDFLPILDGGYSLQYSPLLEYREGKGMVLFCQLDVTGRTESDPAAETLARNLFQYIVSWKPAPRRQAIYVGSPEPRRHLELAGIITKPYEGGEFPPDQVLIVAAGGGQKLTENKAAVASFLKAGGHLMALGLDQQDADAFLPFHVGMTSREHIACYFEPPPAGSLLTGVAPADLHNSDPRTLPLVSARATILGDGVLAQAQDAHVVFYQFPPYALTGSRQTAALDQFNLRRTYRRASVALARLLANMGVSATTPLLSRFATPIAEDQPKLGPSVVRNGDFRRATGSGAADEWQFPSEARQATCTRQALEGNDRWALCLANSDSAGKQPASVMLAQQDMPVKEGQWYRISLKARAEGMAGKAVTLALQSTQTWRSLLDYQSFTPTENWRTFRFLVKSRGTAEKNTRFQIWHEGNGTLWLADIAVDPAPPATSGRWSQGLYLDQPKDWDDPYRFFRW
jgi:beta-galactosidase